jgi:hypothetical protein
MKNLLTITLIFLSLGSNSQEILTIGKVFDFEVSDEFQLKGPQGYQPPNADRLKVIGKSYSEDMKTVFYTILRDRYSTTVDWEPEPHLNYCFIKDTVKQSYTDLDSSIFTYNFLRYDSIVKYYGTNFTYDSIIERSPDYCDTLLNGFDCGLGSFEPTTYKRIYGRGLGLVSQLQIDGDVGMPVRVNQVMFYYKKNGKECGTPDLTTKVENDINSDNFLIVYPNPANSKFLIKINSPDYCYFSLYNFSGSLVASGSLRDELEYDVSTMQKGIYLLHMKFKKGISSKKIIIE